MNAFCMRMVIAALVLAAFGGRSAAGAEPAGGNLKVITYNVQFLPKMFRKLNKRPDVDYRAEALGEQLRSYDLIGLNEVFDEEPRARLLATLKASFGDAFHHALPPAKSKTTLGIGSGLAFVGRLPIVDSNYMRYPMSNRPVKNFLFADGAAAKGAMHVRLRDDSSPAGPCEVDVYVTHLESRDAGVRGRQCQTLGEFVGAYRDPARPVLILGDFNIEGGKAAQADEDSPYHDMLRCFRAELPDHELHDVWALLGDGDGVTLDAEDEGDGERIDYVLVANPKADAPRLLPQSIRVNGFADQRVGALSDHAAVEAEFRWQLP